MKQILALAGILAVGAGCFPGKNMIRPPMYKELDHTFWLVQHLDDVQRSDTITFIFGYYNTGEVGNILEYRSPGVREQCDFTVINDILKFISGTSPLTIPDTSSYCRYHNELVLEGGAPRYARCILKCGDDSVTIPNPPFHLTKIDYRDPE